MSSYLAKTVHAAPLAVFRTGFGLMIFAGLVRFWWMGWIDALYIRPRFFFPYYGFEFVKPLGPYIYLVFLVALVSSALVALGWFYRVSATLLFLSFTYIELIDKSTYLNHYYFISMICLLMIFLPAHVYFSVDAFSNRHLAADKIPAWAPDSIKLFVCLLYGCAGLAKINSDWLLNALPLKIWLPARNDMPLIGHWFNKTWVWYAFSWLGCLYDLFIPFLLLYRRTRPMAFILVVVFHVLTAVLFPIGMFPYIMIMTALIFFSADFHKKLIKRLSALLKLPERIPGSGITARLRGTRLTVAFLFFFFLVQLFLPFRYLCYPGELFWTEEGYRFSWRVMLMEKAGYAQFTVKDKNGRSMVVNNNEFLTPLQEKMMSTQPDMLLQYAHHLAGHYAGMNFKDPEVYVDSYVALNGRLGKPLVYPGVDLAREQESFKHKSWIVPFEDEIKGF